MKAPVLHCSLLLACKNNIRIFFLAVVDKLTGLAKDVSPFFQLKRLL